MVTSRTHPNHQKLNSDRRNFTMHSTLSIQMLPRYELNASQAILRGTLLCTYLI